jgi:hypothetical protein
MPSSTNNQFVHEEPTVNFGSDPPGSRTHSIGADTIRSPYMVDPSVSGANYQDHCLQYPTQLVYFPYPQPDISYMPLGQLFSVYYLHGLHPLPPSVQWDSIRKYRYSMDFPSVMEGPNASSRSPDVPVPVVNLKATVQIHTTLLLSHIPNY